MNPFQPPADDLPARFPSQRRGSGFVVTGETLIGEKGASLPDLCLYSGKPASGERTTKKFVWAPPALAILVAFSPLIYLIVYFIVRKSGTLQYSLSDEARQRRTTGMVIAFGSLFASIALFVVGVREEAPLVFLGALVLMLVGLIVGSLRARIVHVVKIDQTHVHLKLRPEAAQAFAAALAR